MLLENRLSPIAAADYLVAERDATIRHEYVVGDVYEMAGGSRQYNIITFNIAGLLHSQLPTSCQGGVLKLTEPEVRLPFLAIYKNIMFL